MRFGFLIVFFLTGCLSSELRVSHPRSGMAIKKVSMSPITNFTEYDDVPRLLEDECRSLLRHRYALAVLPEGGDVTLKLTFKLYRRGSLSRADDNRDQSKSLIAIALLEMFGPDGTLLDHSEKQRTEVYKDVRVNDFDAAQNLLIKRLADQLVVDLLEP